MSVKNQLHTYRVTFYDEAGTVLAIADVRSFSIGLAYGPAIRYLEREWPGTALIVRDQCTAFHAGLIGD